MRFLILLSALALTACGSDTPGAGATAADAASAPPSDACDALTAAMVADALGVPASDVTHDTERIAQAVDMRLADEGEQCSYLLADGGNYEGVTISTDVFDSDADAKVQFSARYQARAEVSEIEAAGDRATSELDADQLETLDGMDVGAALGSMAEKFWYQDLPGVGDQAALEVTSMLTPTQPSGAFVRRGSAIYHVLVDREQAFSQQPGIYDAMETTLTALARKAGGG